MEIVLDKLKDLSHLLSTIQISDVADILIVTFLVYRLLLMIRSTSTSRIAKAIVVLLVASGLTPPGLVVGGLLGGPPALYFWYSRKQRRREFQVARTITLAALDNRQAMLREFRKGLEPD